VDGEKEDISAPTRSGGDRKDPRDPFYHGSTGSFREGLARRVGPARSFFGVDLGATVGRLSKEADREPGPAPDLAFGVRETDAVLGPDGPDRFARRQDADARFVVDFRAIGEIAQERGYQDLLSSGMAQLDRSGSRFGLLISCGQLGLDLLKQRAIRDGSRERGVSREIFPEIVPGPAHRVADRDALLVHDDARRQHVHGSPEQAGLFPARAFFPVLVASSSDELGQMSELDAVILTAHLQYRQ